MAKADAMEVAFKEAKKNAKQNPTLEENERLNGRMSYDEFRQKYNVEDADTFEELSKMIYRYDHCITLLTIAFEKWDAKSWPEFHEQMNEAEQVTEHFKKYLRERLTAERS